MQTESAMPLESDIKEALLKRLQHQKLLSQASAEEVVAALEKDSPVNWNLILNKEIKAGLDHETSH